MKEKLNIIHWVLVADLVLSIILHEVILSKSKAGLQIPAMLESVFVITIYGALLFIMAAFAGVAVYFWKKASQVGSMSPEKVEYPKKSSIAAVIAIVVFTLYWMI